MKEGNAILDKINLDYKEMLKKKQLIIETGYDEKDFTDEYWLGGIKQSAHFTPRIKRGCGNLPKYFNDLYALLGFSKLKSELKIIDIGAGAGNIVNGLVENGFNSFGCEYSASGRRLAKEYFDIDLQECDLRGKLDYPDDSFDFGICNGVLSMIPKDFIQNAINEICRIVKIAVLVNIGAFVATNINKDDKEAMNPHHLINLTSLEYYQMFRNAGAFDASVIQPPQRSLYGIGTWNEFCGLFYTKDIGNNL